MQIYYYLYLLFAKKRSLSLWYVSKTFHMLRVKIIVCMKEKMDDGLRFLPL